MSNDNPLSQYRGKELVQSGNFNTDAWHAMQQRDDSLIRDQVLHGYTGKEYVYEFKIGGTKVTGVSVVGARELASHYGGIKSRIVASVDKTGELFVFKSFEPLAIQVQKIRELAAEPDFYEVVLEITDIKTGNSNQTRKKEFKTEKRSANNGGGSYERPHYDVIAESKAYRNGVLSIIPQNIIQEFERRALAAGNSSSEKTIEQLREGVVLFASKNAIALERQAVNDMLFAEINGLGTAAGQGVDSFREAAEALGILRTVAIEQQKQEEKPIGGASTDVEKKDTVKSVKGGASSTRTTPAATPAPAKAADHPVSTPASTPAAATEDMEPAKYADVLQALQSAKTVDELNEAADLIRSIKQPVHRQQLNAIYDDRAAAFNVGSDDL